MPSYEAAIIAAARRVARAQAKCRRLRRELAETQTELKHAKRDLRAIAGAARDPFTQSPPVRGFDES